MTRYEYFLTAIKEHGDKDECLLWPFAKNKDGYGYVWNGKSNCRINRLSLEYKLNRPITFKLLACHTCHTRHCFAQAHLYEGTSKQNRFDMIADETIPIQTGDKNNNAIIDDTKALEIREKYATGLFFQRELANEYNVSQRLISKIIRRELWSHI